MIVKFIGVPNITEQNNIHSFQVNYVRKKASLVAVRRKLYYKKKYAFISGTLISYFIAMVLGREITLTSQQNSITNVQFNFLCYYFLVNARRGNQKNSGTRVIKKGFYLFLAAVDNYHWQADLATTVHLCFSHAIGTFFVNRILGESLIFCTKLHLGKKWFLMVECW